MRLHALYSSNTVTNLCKIQECMTGYHLDTSSERCVIITYKIGYTLNSGTAGSSNPTTATYDVAVTISNPTRAGYNFKGWVTEKPADMAADIDTQNSLLDKDARVDEEEIVTLDEFVKTGKITYDVLKNEASGKYRISSRGSDLEKLFFFLILYFV